MANEIYLSGNTGGNTPWKTYEEAVKAGYANIMTPEGFAAADAETHRAFGTYEGYLKNIWNTLTGNRAGDDTQPGSYGTYLSGGNNAPSVGTGLTGETGAGGADISYGTNLGNGTVESGSTAPVGLSAPVGENAGTSGNNGVGTDGGNDRRTGSSFSSFTGGAYNGQNDPEIDEIDKSTADIIAGITDKTASSALALSLNMSRDVFDQVVKDLENARRTGTEVAEATKGALVGLAKEERDRIYDYVEKKYARDAEYAQTQYDELAAAIEEARTTGKQLAEDELAKLMSMTEEQRQIVYGMAQSNEESAAARAASARERAMIDEETSYARNMAGYGAKAETLGSMGLGTSGYSDYLNASAYSTYRAGVANANAQAERSLREAREAADKLRYQANLDKSERDMAAQSAYYDKMSGIDTSYRTNMLNARQQYNAAMKSAEDEKASGIYGADDSYGANVADAEAQYGSAIADVESTYARGLSQASQEKTVRDYNALTTALEEQANADNRYKQKYGTLLEAAKSGGYTASDIEELARRYGMSEKDVSALSEAAQTAYDDAEAAKDEQGKTDYANTYTTLYSNAAKGLMSGADMRDMAKKYGMSEEDAERLAGLAESYYNDAQEKIAKEKADLEEKKGKDYANTYTTLYSNALKGMISGEDMRAMAEMNGMGEEQIAALKRVAQEAYDAEQEEIKREKADLEEKKGKDYANTYTTLYSNAAKGLMSGADMRALAEMNGMAEKQIAALESVAQTAYEDAEKDRIASEGENYNARYKELIGLALSGDVTEEQLRTMAENYGIKSEDVASVLGTLDDLAEKKEAEEKAAADAEREATYEEYLGGAEIDYEDGTYDQLSKTDLTPEQKAEVVKKANETLISTIQEAYDDSTIKTALSDADKRYKSGDMTRSEWQNAYFESELRYIADAEVPEGVSAEKNTVDRLYEIEKLYKEGKISKEDSDNLKKYALSAHGGKVDTTATIAKYSWRRGSAEAIYNGKKYLSNVFNNAARPIDGKNEIEILNAMSDGNENTLVMFNGELYVKDGEKWYSFQNDDLKGIVEDELRRNKPGAPKHASEPSGSTTDAYKEAQSEKFAQKKKQ